MKNIVNKMSLLLAFLVVFITKVFADAPSIKCEGLPGCKSSSGTNTDGKFAFTALGNVISTAITYVSVISVFVLVFAGINYILTLGNDDKAVKARKMIIWSLVGVLVSNSAWMLINLVNSFSLSN